MSNIELVTKPENNTGEPESSLQTLQTLIDESPKEDQKPEDRTFDEDGFKVPKGKIPLDAQFSTNELEELVELSQKKGILADVDVKIIQHSEVVGDRIVLSDSKDKENNEDSNGDSNGDSNEDSNENSKTGNSNEDSNEDFKQSKDEELKHDSNKDSQNDSKKESTDSKKEAKDSKN